MTEKAIHILLIEDHADCAELLQSNLSRVKGFQFKVEQARSLVEGLKCIERGGLDIILLDLSLPDSQKWDTFNKVHEMAMTTPIIVLTALDDDAFAQDVVRKGAQDYIVKGQVDSAGLARVVRYAIERKRTEVALKKTEIDYHMLFDASRDCVFMVKKSGRWIDVNQAGAALFGFKTREELMKTSMNDFYINVRDRWDHLADIEKNKSSKNYEVTLKKRDGKIIYALINAVPRRDEATGLIIGYQGIITDITERKRAEKLKDEFISTVSHELRTPLTSVREVVSQVLEGILGPTTEQQRQFLSMSLEDIDRLRRIIDNLLDISKIEAGKVEIRRDWVDMMTLIQGVAGLFEVQAKQKGIEVKTRGSQKSIKIYADRDKLIQVFTNLVGNALKFTPEGHVEMSVEDEDDCITCSVTDTGYGIKEGDLPRVFGKFQQFDRAEGKGEKGTGLGLSIAKGIVELHGGKIHVKSTEGKGTSFIFRLPKYTARSWFRECVADCYQQAIGTGNALSLMVFEADSAEEIKEKLGRDRLAAIVKSMKEVVVKNLRRHGDIALSDESSVFVLLPATKREDAQRLGERIYPLLTEVVSKKFSDKTTKVLYRLAGFPDGGRSVDELLGAVHARETVAQEQSWPKV